MGKARKTLQRLRLGRAAVSAALGLALAIVTQGCATTGPTDQFRRDRTLREYFTPEARAVLRHVPMHYGELPGFDGFAIGNDPGTRLAGMILGFGNRRQVVVDADCDGLTIFHEYIHQAQYSGLIDTRLFLERYERLRQDPHYARIPRTWESYIRRRYGQSTAAAALIYGRGITRELIAYLIQGRMEGWYDLPDYMLDVYRDTVRLDAAPRRS